LEACQAKEQQRHARHEPETEARLMADLTKTWIGCDPGNFAVGRAGYKPEAIVIHLAAGSLIGTDSWFLMSPEKRGEPASSAHYCVGKEGQIHQYVKEEDRAYHAGRVLEPTAKLVTETFPGVNPNLWTIGIEHEGMLDDDWPEAMIDASAALVAEICLRWDIPIDRDHIIKHHEVFSAKPCPGPKCPIDLIVEMAQKPFAT
jgi:N-acetylmuramoyl-L-alanine amidase